MSSTPPAVRGRYTSTRRIKQAEQTRNDVLAAAVRLFASSGWAGTTLAAVAGDAGVAVETIYAGFKSKKMLLQAAMDVAIAGDGEPVPLWERPEARRLRTVPPDQRLRGIVEWVGRIYSGPVIGVWSAMLEAAANDPDISIWCNEHEQRRYDTIVAWMSTIFPQIDAAASESIWAVSSMETYMKLTRQRGWTPEQWQEWLINTIEILATRA